MSLEDSKTKSSSPIGTITFMKMHFHLCTPSNESGANEANRELLLAAVTLTILPLLSSRHP